MRSNPRRIEARQLMEVDDSGGLGMGARYLRWNETV
jgi:hypothetical protein